jgi:hypothetical protein
MSQESAPSPNISLTPEQESLAIKSATSIEFTTDWVADAQQAIGRAFSCSTADAVPIFNELLRRGLIEARPEPGGAKINNDPGFQDSHTRAKFYRSNFDDVT